MKKFLPKKASDIFLITTVAMSSLLCALYIYCFFITDNNFFDRTKMKLNALEQRIQSIEKKLVDL